MLCQVTGQPLFNRWAKLMGEENSGSMIPRFADLKRGENGPSSANGWPLVRGTHDTGAVIRSARRRSRRPVLSPQEALDHPHTSAPPASCRWNYPACRARPISRAWRQTVAHAGEIRRDRARAAVGEHTDEVLVASAGFENAITALRETRRLKCGCGGPMSLHRPAAAMPGSRASAGRTRKAAILGSMPTSASGPRVWSPEIAGPRSSISTTNRRSARPVALAPGLSCPASEPRAATVSLTWPSPNPTAWSPEFFTRDSTCANATRGAVVDRASGSRARSSPAKSATVVLGATMTTAGQLARRAAKAGFAFAGDDRRRGGRFSAGVAAPRCCWRSAGCGIGVHAELVARPRPDQREAPPDRALGKTLIPGLLRMPAHGARCADDHRVHGSNASGPDSVRRADRRPMRSRSATW